MNSQSQQAFSPEGQVLSEVLFEACRLHGRFLAERDKLVQPCGLTSARWRVLSVIAMASQLLTVPQIGRRIGLSRQNVQRLVDVLEEEEFVIYQGNPDHKRAKLVSLTEKGGRQYEAVMHQYIPWANRCAEGMQEHDLKQTVMVLKHVMDQLDHV